MISILLLLMLVPLLLLMLFFNVATFSFSRLGMSQEGAFLFLTASIIGSMINIPLSEYRCMNPGYTLFLCSFFTTLLLFGSR